MPSRVFFLLLVDFILSMASAQGKPFEFLQNLERTQKIETVKGVYQLEQHLKRFSYFHYNNNNATHANDDEYDELNYHLNVTMMRSSKNNKPRSVDTGSKFKFFPGNPRWPADKYHLDYRLLFNTQVVDIEQFRTVISSAFQRWAAVTKFTFAEAQAFFPCQIRIGFRGVDGPNHVLAYSYRPPNGTFWYDASEKWSNTMPGSDQYDLESVAVHEIGHLLRLFHSDNPKSVMYPTIDPGVKKVDLHDDDIQGIRTLYGW